MVSILHRVAAIIAFLCIATFFSATILVELFGSAEAIATLKSLIVWPGLFFPLHSLARAGSPWLKAEAESWYDKSRRECRLLAPMEYWC